MAEIRVERKKTTNIWPWIIGLILLALVAWGITSAMHRDDNRAGTATTNHAALTLPQTPVSASPAPAALAA